VFVFLKLEQVISNLQERLEAKQKETAEFRAKHGLVEQQQQM